MPRLSMQSHLTAVSRAATARLRPHLALIDRLRLGARSPLAPRRTLRIPPIPAAPDLATPGTPHLPQPGGGRDAGGRTALLRLRPGSSLLAPLPGTPPAARPLPGIAGPVTAPVAPTLGDHPALPDTPGATATAPGQAPAGTAGPPGPRPFAISGGHLPIARHPAARSRRLSGRHAGAARSTHTRLPRHLHAGGATRTMHKAPQGMVPPLAGARHGGVAAGRHGHGKRALSTVSRIAKILRSLSPPRGQPASDRRPMPVLDPVPARGGSNLRTPAFPPRQGWPAAPGSPGRTSPATGLPDPGTPPPPGAGNNPAAPRAPALPTANPGPASLTRPPDGPPAPGPDAPPLPQPAGDLFFDGARVGRWLARALAADAARPPATGAGFDPRRTPAWAPSYYVKGS